MALAACKPPALDPQSNAAGQLRPAVTASAEPTCKPRAPKARTAPTGYAFPALTGRVVDGAKLLSVSERRRLSNRLVDAEKQAKHQFVVVTVTSLDGHDIDDYGLKLANFWGVGRQCYDDGILLIVAPNERKVRIEVGKGLEAALTNAEAKAIVDRDLLPRFKEGDFPSGIFAGSEAIIREINE